MEKLAIIIVDLGYGDAGKGSLVDYLAREHKAHTVVRYNGGPQAAHNVITPDGRHHTFSQFGSALFVPGVNCHLSRFMLVDPIALLEEARHLNSLGVRDALARTTVDRQSLLITPFHIAANRIRELSRGDGRHGSCGKGVGEARAYFLEKGEDAPTIGDLIAPNGLRVKLERLREDKQQALAPQREPTRGIATARQEWEILDDPESVDLALDFYGRFVSEVKIVNGVALEKVLQKPGTVIFEGAQGVLLDEAYGTYPYNTWTNTTTENAFALLKEGRFSGRTVRLGAIRAYQTRHGAGPFVTEDKELSEAIPDAHNGTNEWQNTFRIGWLDAVATRYALKVNGGVDALAVSGLDRIAKLPAWRLATRYRYRGKDPDLAESFRQDGSGIVIDLKQKSSRDDKAFQERQTKRLFDCWPEYRELKSNGPVCAEKIIQEIEKEFFIKTAIVSFGPTAQDKISRFGL